MPETTEQSRLNWIAVLDRIEGLKPHAVVAGHKNPANDDNPQHVAATRKYIRDFNRLNHQTTTIQDLYDKMLVLYPSRQPWFTLEFSKSAKSIIGDLKRPE